MTEIAAPKRRGRPPKSASKPQPAVTFASSKEPVREAPAPTPTQAPLPKAGKLKVRVKGAFPINCYPVGVVVRPGGIFEVPDHEYVRRQITLGMLEEV